MKHNPGIHHRHSIRLKGYDYAQPGAYFVTICTKNNLCLFGEIHDDEMQLNDAGKMVKKWFYELQNKFPDINPDEFICMPNHIHFIVINTGNTTETDGTVAPAAVVVVVGADLRVCPYDVGNNWGEHTGSPLRHIVQWFKTMTTNEYIRGVKQNRWAPFPGKLWHRNYYERIIRDETELHRIRQYIINNPLNWQSDENHTDY